MAEEYFEADDSSPTTNWPNENGTLAAINSTTIADIDNPLLYKIAVTFLFGAISLSGAVGNSLVIYVIVSNRRMRTVTNLLLLNLAIADLSFVLVIPP